MDKAASLCKRLSELKALRTPYEAHWGECYKYGAPERQQNFNDTSGTFYTAKNDRVKLVDSTAAEAILNSMVPTMISGTVPANSIWFKAAPDGVDDPSVLTNGEAWLEPVCQFLWRNIHGSKTFDAEIVDFFTDWCVAGWAVNYTDLDRKNNGGYVFETWPIGECWLATTRKDNQVDTIFRVYEMTAKQICTEYDENKVPLVVKEAAANSPDKKYKILWVIEPRTKHKEYEGKPLLPKQMPFASYHVLMDGEKAILKESGYNEFPCQVARYRRIPGSVYGIGAMSTALPDTKQLQIMQRDFSRALQMAALGMYAGADDGILNTANVRIGPGLFIPVNSTDSIKRIDDARGVPMLENAIEKLQSTIRRKLLADMMTPQYGQPMTAAETYARVDQTRQQIGPLYGRIQSELLIPLLERCFGIAYRAGAIGQAPDDLQGRNLSFKFISPLARAQKLEEIASIERLMASLGTFAELAPDALDNIDFDAVPQVLAAGLGVPTSVMRTEDKLAEYREQKAQAQQQAQAQEQEAMMMQQMTGAAAQGMGKGLEAQMASEVMQ